MSAIFLHDLALILFLAFLEGILSIDNAIVLALMAGRLPRAQQKKALTYGLFGAITFRLVALSVVTRIMSWPWVKIIGGAYLLWVALRHLLRQSHPDDPSQDVKQPSRGFWRTVVLIELMDIAFAADSILAAVAVTAKIWIVFFGGMIGVVLMRFAAAAFIALLRRFPRLESVAYFLVLLIGAKLLLQGLGLGGEEFENPRSPWFLCFWALMAATIAAGFIRPRRSPR